MPSLKLITVALPAVAFAAPKMDSPTTAVTPLAEAHPRRDAAADAQAPPVVFSWTSDGQVIVATASDFGAPGDAAPGEATPVTFSWTSDGAVIVATASNFGPATTTSSEVTISSFSPVATIAPPPSSTVPPAESSTVPPAESSTTSIPPVTTSVSAAADSTSVPVSVQSSTSSSVTAPPAPPPMQGPPPPSGTSCPELGPNLLGQFTLTFDDTDTANGAQANLFNPYHALYFSNGFTYGPPPTGPVQPLSPPNVARFDPSQGSTDTGSPDAAGNLPGEFTSGPEPSNSALWFNTYDVWLACDSPADANASCLVEFFLYAWNNATNVVHEVGQGSYDVPPCRDSSCGLWPMGQQFAANGLTGVQIHATVNGNPVPFFMENVELGWFNNSCEAALARSQVH